MGLISGETARPDNSLSGALTRKYLLVLGLILFVSLAAFTVFQELLRTQVPAEVVNQSGRQRMLVHRIALYASLLQQERRPEWQRNLDHAIDDLQAAHAFVQKNVDRGLLFGAWGWWSAEETVGRQMQVVDVSVMAFIRDARTYSRLVSEEGATFRVLALGERLFETATRTLLERLEQSMREFERVAGERARWLQVFAVVGEGLTVLLLIFSGIGIFRPLVREIARKIKAMQHLQAYHHSMMDNVGDGVATFDHSMSIRFANATFGNMFRRHPTDLVGWPITRVVPELAGEVDGIFEATVRRFEMVHLHEDGSQVILDVSMLIFDFYGDSQCIVSMRDVTERKHLENRLRLFYYAIEHSPLSIVITDTSGIIEYANRRCAEVAGFPLEEIIGSSPRIFKSGQTPNEVYRLMWRKLVEGREWFGEILNRRKNGELYWEFEAISALKNDAGEVTHFIAIKEDITEKKKSAAALVDAKRQAEIASRAKSEFLANMSHELRTPLNAIIGFAEIMKLGLFGKQENPKYDEYSYAIHDSAKHLLGIINDILDFSKLEAGRVSLFEEIVPLGEVIASVLLIAKERADARGIRLALGGDGQGLGDLPDLQIDVLRYKQVLLNIVSNAVKFTPKGGEVTISPHIDPDGGLSMIVKDTGIGMNEEDIPKALERFGQVDSALHRKYEGTGLGLPISKSLIELHGGSLQLRSREGEGTTAIIRLPPARIITGGRRLISVK